MIRLQRLARNAPHQLLEEGYEQAGSSSLQLLREVTPHVTFGPDILESTQPITNANPPAPTQECAWIRAGQERNGSTTVGPENGKLVQKKSYRQRATAGTRKYTHNSAVNARPHKKRKAQFPGHGLGCTRPSPRGRTRTARGQHSGDRNGTTTATPRRDIFDREFLSPHKLGDAKFKIPTGKRASNQPGDQATSIMSGNEGSSSAIIIRGRHSPPP